MVAVRFQSKISQLVFHSKKAQLYLIACVCFLKSSSKVQVSLLMSIDCFLFSFLKKGEQGRKIYNPH